MVGYVLPSVIVSVFDCLDLGFDLLRDHRVEAETGSSGMRWWHGGHVRFDLRQPGIRSLGKKPNGRTKVSNSD